MKWEMNYSLNYALTERSIVGFEKIDDIEFVINRSEDGHKLAGFKIHVNALAEDDAKTVAQLQANIIFDYLTGIHGYPIKGHLDNFIKSDGRIAVENDITLRWNAYTSEDIDLSSIEDILNGEDIRLMRQLSHYRAGLSASKDLVTQVREFYMIVEDEYGDETHEKHDFINKYKYVRALVSHAQIDDQETIDHFEDRGFDINKSWFMRVEDLKSPISLAVSLRNAKKPQYRHIRNKLSSELQQLLDEYDESSPMSKKFQDTLIKDINKIIQGPNIYDGKIFKRIKLTPKTEKLIEQNPKGEDLLRLNRLLLEFIYRAEIAKSRKNYFYPNNPKDIEIIKRDLGSIKTEAGQIIRKKVGDSS